MYKHVLAVRIYYKNGCMPMADLLMNDYVVEHIEWNNPKQRKEFLPYMNGYTLFYDERQKKSWKEINDEGWIVRISARTKEEIIDALCEKYSSTTHLPIVIEDGKRVLFEGQVLGRIRDTGVSWVYEEKDTKETQF